MHFDTVRFDTVHFGTVRFDTLRFDTVRFDTCVLTLCVLAHAFWQLTRIFTQLNPGAAAGFRPRMCPSLRRF